MALAANSRGIEKANPRLLDSFIRADNICDLLTDDKITAIGQTVIVEYQMDVESRKSSGWLDRTETAMDLAMQVRQAKNYPWPNASNVKYPLLTTAAIQFNARAYPAIVDGGKVVKGKVFGQPSEEKQARADRIAAHMSYQLIEEMPGWEEDTDRMLLMLPIVGCMFRKTWFDPVMKVNRSEAIGPLAFVANYMAKSIEACPRYSQVLSDIYPHQIVEKQRAGLWRNVDFGMPENANGDELAPLTFIEQHRLLDLDEDGYPEPYIVTAHEQSGQVARIVARYDADGVKLNARGEVERIEPVSYFTKYSFIPSPDGSFYDIGFGQLLDSLNGNINTILNQLNDAGHLANTQGGFIGGGVSIKSGNMRFQPGEWKKVQIDGGQLRDGVLPLPAKEPSSVLFNLLNMLIEAARDITSTKDILTGETQGSNQAVGTTLATIEQGLKVFTAIYKRIHRALKQELAKLRRLNRLFLEDEAYFNFQDIDGVVGRADYADEDMDVLPVSDPTVVSDMQRLGRAQYLMQFRGDPGIVQPELNKRLLEAASVSDVKALLVPPPDPSQAAPDPAIMLETAKLEQRQQEIGLKVEEQAAKTVEAKAKVLLLKAQTMAALVAIEQPGSVMVDAATGEALAETPGEIDPELLAMMDRMAAQVDTEFDAEADRIEDELQQEENADGQPVDEGDVSGMEGAPVDSGFREVPEGPAGDFGGGMDGGGGPEFIAAGEGAVDGGIGGPGMG